VPVGVLHRYDAVGGDQDGPVEAGELEILHPPGVAVIAGQVRVFPESGVVVRGPHLGVGVDVDAFAGGLLQQFRQVPEVVAGHQDARFPPDAQGDGAGSRLPVRGGVGPVQQRHGVDHGLAGRDGQVAEPRFVGLLGDGGQGAVHEPQQGVVVKAVGGRVRHVGGDALERVGGQFLQRTDAFVGRVADVDGHRLLAQFPDVPAVPGEQVPQPGQDPGLVRVPEPVADRQPLMDHGDETVRVEGGVGDGGIERLGEKYAGFPVDRRPRGGGFGRDGDALQDENQQVLVVGCLVGLAAGAEVAATGVFAGLLALVAEHVHGGSPGKKKRRPEARRRFAYTPEPVPAV